MKAFVREGHAPLYHPDGSLVRLIHAETGHLTPVRTYECVVTLDGKACQCFAADEEAGVVEVVARDADGQEIRLENDPFTPLRTFLKGEVKIIATPILCECDECLGVIRLPGSVAVPA